MYKCVFLLVFSELAAVRGASYAAVGSPECVTNAECSAVTTCMRSRCVNLCSGVCGLNFQCNVVNHIPICTCTPGRTGIACSSFDEPEDPCSPSPCGSNAVCRDGTCTCQPGYRGDPDFGCYPEIPECISDNACPRNKACMNNKCRDPCSPICGSNAVCEVRNHIPVCSCPSGYEGSPFVKCTKVIAPSTTLLKTTGPPKLRVGELIMENYTQIYHYDFTDGEEIGINCSLSSNGGFEKHYHLAIRLTESSLLGVKGQNDTFILHNFKLKKTDSVILCRALKITEKNPAIPYLLFNVVRLHYYPSVTALPPTLSSVTPSLPDFSDGVTVTTSPTPVNQSLAESAGHPDTQSSGYWWLVGAVILLILIVVAFACAAKRFRKEARVQRERIENLEAERRQEEAIRNRPPCAQPQELLYEDVYAHGAGLKRPRRK